MATAAERIAKLRTLPQDALGVFLSDEECAWLLDAAEALDRLMTHLAVNTEAMTVCLGTAEVAYFPEDAPAISRALRALGSENGHCVSCGDPHPWRDLDQSTYYCAECAAVDVAMEVEARS
jgi:hypothetical protein